MSRYPTPRTAIVTGGASGLGLALTRALVARGAHVVVADLDEVAAARAVTGLDGPGTAEAVGLDVTDEAGVLALVRRVETERTLDLLVNNAGFGVGGSFEQLTSDHWRRQLEVNLYGVLHGCLAAYPLMRARRGGQILNTASLSGLLPSPGLAPYSTSKHAVVGLTQALRAEARPHGVGVTALCPGWVDTPLLDQANPADLVVASGPQQGMRSTIPLLATGKPVGADLVAAKALASLARDRGLVVVPGAAYRAWLGSRITPQGAGRLAGVLAGRVQQAWAEVGTTHRV